MDALAACLLPWFKQHGRRLPWPRTPYHTWVSEIMLQQTRVETVIPYYERFIHDFPTLGHLARASLDQVLHRWSGLGYYARARNLHKAAHIILHSYGELPRSQAQLQALPGIGRSTAGAILALGYGIPGVVLDGNVRRVLVRYHAIREPGVTRRLWQLAESHLPSTHAADYTQALMDLGAGVCKRMPRCMACPLHDDCQARQQGIQQQLPVPRPTRTLPLRHTRFLLIQDAQGQVYMERRPPAGLWGGLWSPPECPSDCEPAARATQHLGIPVRELARLPAFTHTFTHFRLHIEPVHLHAERTRLHRLADTNARWMSLPPREVGLAAPVARLFAIMCADEDRQVHQAEPGTGSPASASSSR